MLIPQSDRKKIFEHLFEDGVCIAKKDYNLKSHPEIKGVRNLYVIKALKVFLQRINFKIKSSTGQLAFLGHTFYLHFLSSLPQPDFPRKSFFGDAGREALLLADDNIPLSRLERPQ